MGDCGAGGSYTQGAIRAWFVKCSASDCGLAYSSGYRYELWTRLLLFTSPSISNHDHLSIPLPSSCALNDCCDVPSIWHKYKLRSSAGGNEEDPRAIALRGSNSYLFLVGHDKTTSRDLRYSRSTSIHGRKSSRLIILCPYSGVTLLAPELSKICSTLRPSFGREHSGVE